MKLKAMYIANLACAYLTIRTAGFSESLYDFPPVSKSIWRLIASRRLTWPFNMLANVGEFASVQAPESASNVKAMKAGQITFKISHECLCATVQGIHNHLPISGAGDFHTPVLQSWGWRCALPSWICPNMRSL